MAKVKRGLCLASVLALALIMLFGCARLFWDAPQQSGWYIQLNVGDPGAKGIGVDEYDVTGVSIAVYGPEDQLLDSFQWDAAGGPQSYSVQVNQAGTHRIKVTHVGENDGEVVEAEESAEFDIVPMVITVVDIIPGAIGLIRVDGEPVGDPFAWLYGYWVEDPAAAPYTNYLEINEGGFWQWWERYDGSGGVFESGEWYVEDGTLMLVVEGEHVPTIVTKLSNDEVILDMTIFQAHLFRKGAEPLGYVFDQVPVDLPMSAGEWTEGLLADFEMELYSFQAPAAGMYDIYWKQGGDPDPPSFTANITVSAYAEDQSTPFFEWEEMGGYFTPMTVYLESGDIMYIVVDAWYSGGTYGIRVMDP